MLQVLQYFTGTSIAAVVEPADLIMVQLVIDGARASGSSEVGGGMGWRLRGKILMLFDYK